MLSFALAGKVEMSNPGGATLVVIDGYCNFGAQPAELKYTNPAGRGLAGRGPMSNVTPPGAPELPPRSLTQP